MFGRKDYCCDSLLAMAIGLFQKKPNRVDGGGDRGVEDIGFPGVLKK